jgi:monovalent cation:H+ antiporter-2, CPA2 family
VFLMFSIGLVVLVLVYAMWRNLWALADELSKVSQSRLFDAGLIAFGIRVVSTVVSVYWLYLLLPTDDLPTAAWVVIAVLAVAIAAVFSGRLAHWHGIWKNSVREVLEQKSGCDEKKPAGAPLGESLGGWDMEIDEFVMSSQGTAVGKTLAELTLPSRFGVSVLQLERNGYAVEELSPSTGLFAGDHLLLVGSREGLDSATTELNSGADYRRANRWGGARARSRSHAGR